MPRLSDRNEKRIVTIPNILCVLRLLFLPFILHFLGKNDQKSDFIAVVLMALGASTDFLDGYIARRFKQTSNLGRILDPLIDKIYIIAIMFFLVNRKGLPLWYLTVVIARDLAIVTGGIYVIFRRQFISESNLVGKFTSFSFLPVIATYTLGLEPWNKLTVWLSMCLIVLSVTSYTKVFLRLLSLRK